jgi:DNA-binding response OmpR family regulator
VARILVVDDDEGFVEFIAHCLSAERHEVLTAFNGRQGCEIAQKEKPDIVILDLLMPDMHGFEVCQKIRDDQRLKDTKIIISTVKSYAVDKKAALRLGADAYLTKPYSAQELLDTVKKMLDDSGARGSI